MATEGDDVLYAYGNDELPDDDQVIDGLGGNDQINGASGNDYLLGSAGNDTLRGDVINGTVSFGTDYLDGGTGDDRLYGEGGNDTLAGGTGNDVLYGDGYVGGNDPRDGNDTIYAGTGADHVLGGSGNDVIYADGSFADGPDRLEGGLGNDVYIVDGGANIILTDDGGHDRLEISSSVSLQHPNGAIVVEIEDLTLTGTGAFAANGNSLDNVMRGNAAGNILRGYDGTDTLFGNDGNDWLEGGFGSLDTLRGGRGDDTYVVTDFDDIWEDVNQGSDTVRSSVRWVLAANFESLVLTGAANVNGFGNELANTLTGNSGNNYLAGQLASDTLQGGAGNDFYALGDVNAPNPFSIPRFDTVIEVANAGSDTVEINSETGDPFVDSYTLTADVETGIIVGAAAFDLAGNASDNVLIGNNFANLLTGNGGNDILDGNAGLDRAGLDTLAGGLGNDTYELSDRNYVGQFEDYAYDSAVEGAGAGIDFVKVTTRVSPNFYSNYTLTANVENGALFGADVFNLTGNELANALTGNGAVNGLFGLGGNDTLSGGLGADILIGGTGNDTYELRDRYFVGQFEDYVYDTVTEEAGAGIDSVNVMPVVSPNFSSNYTLAANVENGTLLGTVAFNLSGNAIANSLGGNSAANGLFGLGGNDFLAGFAGGDVLVGGLGFDYATYGPDPNGIDFSLAGVLADLLLPGFNTGDAAGDSYDGIEGLVGSLYGDNLRGDNNGNALSGGSGGNDTLFGRGGNDALGGGIGNDLLFGGLGADRHDGGAGSDTASYAIAAATNPATAAGLIADLLVPRANTGEAAGDTYVSIENLTGSAFNDSLRGDNLANRVDGGNGNDALFGRGGNDVLVGGAGNDLFAGGLGADRHDGGPGADTASYAGAAATNPGTGAGLIADLLVPGLNTGEAAGDTYVSIQYLTGSAFSDVLRGDNLANFIDGGSGNDALFGRSGNDALFGAAGNDFLTGGLGQDRLTGGTGIDRFDFNLIGETGTTAATRDIVSDFLHLTDRIDLSTIDAIAGGANNAFDFIQGGPFTAAGQVRAFQAGGDTIIELNTVGASGAEAQIVLSGIAAATLTDPDFVL